jgi:hypothetical protein
MGKVVHLPPRDGRTGEADAERAARAKAVRRRLEEHPGGFAREISTAAAELHRVIEEQGAGFKARLCSHVFGSETRYPTKRLWGVVWDPNGKEPRMMKRRQRATIYVRLSDGAADLMGISRDEMLLRVFPGVEADTAALAHAPAGGIADELREELWAAWTRATEVISRDLDLRRALRIMMEVPFEHLHPLPVLTLEFNQVLGKPQDIVEQQDPAGYAIAPSPWTYVMGVAPKLFLGECAVRTLCASVEALTEKGRSPRRMPKLTSWATVWLRFWWAILPIGPAGEPRGCFLASLATTRLTKTFAKERWSHFVGEQIPPPDRPVPWTTLLNSELSREGPVWSFHHNRDRRAPGLALEWEVSSDNFKRRFRCIAEPDEVTRRVILAVFGRDLSKLPPNPIRILPATPTWRDAILGLADGSLADWVGPNPDEPGTPLPAEPRMENFETDEADEAAEEVHSTALDEWEDKENAYQERLATMSEGLTAFGPVVLPYEDSRSSVRTSIGGKLERSLLELDEEDRPDVALRRQAKQLADRVRKVVTASLTTRRARLSALGRPPGAG